MAEFKLKPCPFCGGEAEFFSKTYRELGVKRGWDFGIYCKKCDFTYPKNYKLEIDLNSEGEIVTTIDERPIAAEKWNRRADNG